MACETEQTTLTNATQTHLANRNTLAAALVNLNNARTDEADKRTAWLLSVDVKDAAELAAGEALENAGDSDDAVLAAIQSLLNCLGGGPNPNPLPLTKKVRPKKRKK